MVFDEVDSGIGGAIAEIVGRELRSLGEGGQVLCVTHLPQVASQGHHHLRVAKSTDGRTTRTALTELAPQDRVEEIARMLGGIESHRSKAREHAREMLRDPPGAAAGSVAHRPQKAALRSQGFVGAGESGRASREGACRATRQESSSGEGDNAAGACDRGSTAGEGTLRPAPTSVSCHRHHQAASHTLLLRKLQPQLRSKRPVP